MAVLMDSARSAEKGTVIYPNVTAEQTIVRNNNVVSKLAIVPHVHPDHEKVPAPDGGRAVRPRHRDESCNARE